MQLRLYEDENDEAEDENDEEENVEDAVLQKSRAAVAPSGIGH